MAPVDFISTNKDFQSSVNIAYDFGSEEKIKSLIATDTVCRYLEDILKDVMQQSPNRAKSLVAPYGTGKSHITLAALSSMWIKNESLYEGIIAAYRERGSEFADDFERFVTDGPRLLPVVISGSSSDLRHSLLFALRNALRREGLEQLMPQTNFDGALKVLDRWQTDYPETLSGFEAITKTPIEVFRSNLRNMDTQAYDELVSLYPKLSSGSTFDALEDADVISIYETVLESLYEEGISGIYVVYDEFSKYLEANISSASVEDVKLLQDFAERCTRSTQDRQLHLLLISHKTLTNYIDAKLPKNKRDGWNGVSGRFQEVEIRSDFNQSYELMSHAIVKDNKKWTAWLGRNEETLEAIKARYLSSKSSELLNGIREDCLIYGCYPLHPISACILPRLSAKVAQNERTLFTFICSTGESSLMSAVGQMEMFVSPDVIYDYFEPLIKKEYYSTEIRRIYGLARKSIEIVSNDELCVRIVKTIALIHIIDQPRLIRPTEQVINEIFSDCGRTQEEIDLAIHKLVNSESVIYHRDSNGYLKLKESSGINIEEKVNEAADIIRLNTEPCEILNDSQLARAIYPSRHNELHSIIRYFDCGFVPVKQLQNDKGDIENLGEGDGAIFAAFPSSPDEVDGLEDIASSYTKKNPMCVVSIPLEYQEIEKYLYRYAAAKSLREEVDGDSVLEEEYGIVVDDCSEIINEYVEGLFRPELRRAKYYAKGQEADGVTRRRRLSDLLSDLCEEAFPYTPSITHETLNKNEMTGAGRSSRMKLIVGLCASHLTPNLGIVGSGQELAMASSALRATGIIADLNSPVVNLEPDSPEIRRVLAIVEKFVTGANEESFSVLYEELTGRAEKIGMKKGPIPLFLSLVLRIHSDEVVITFQEEEKSFSAELIQDIDARPEKYIIKQMDWTAEKSDYTKRIAELFGCEDSVSRSEVAEAIRRWFVLLPQITRNARIDHTKQNNKGRISFEEHLAFLRVIMRSDIDSSQLLFKEIPRVFGEALDSEQLIEKLSDEKQYCDGFVALSTQQLCDEVKAIINPSAHSDASLFSVIQDWTESLSAEALSFVYSGITNVVFNSLRQASRDDLRTIKQLARDTTSLRIEDWRDDRFDDFLEIINQSKNEIDGLSKPKSDSTISEGRLSISFFDGEKEQTKVFTSVASGQYTEMLRRSLTACLDEMGASISEDEKRQAVFDVLRSLC